MPCPPNNDDSEFDLLFKIAQGIAAGGGGGGGGAPSGPAGGGLGGTYPNPTVPGLSTLKQFPSYNSIYLDQNFAALSAQGLAAFGTWQTAYDAADALVIATGQPVMMLVGNGGTLTAFGDLVLTADYNPQVAIIGYGPQVGSLGNLIASSATNGFAVTAVMNNVRLNSIVTKTTSVVAGANNGGNVAITVHGEVQINSIDTSALTSGNGGDVNLFGESMSSAVGIDARGLVNGGFVQLNLNPQSGITSIQTGSLGSGQAGDIYSFGQFIINALDLSSVSGSGGNLRVTNTLLGQTTMGTSNPGPIQAIRSMFLDKIDMVLGTSQFTGVDFMGPWFAPNNNDCIGDLFSDGAQFVGCRFFPTGTGLAVNSTAPHTVLFQEVVSRANVGVNVTVNGSGFTVDTSLTVPVI